MKIKIKSIISDLDISYKDYKITQQEVFTVFLYYLYNT